MRYRRVSDGQTVSATEACDAAGTVRNGYAIDAGLGQSFVKPGDYIGFDMAFLDSASRPGAPSSGLTAEQQAAVVARARMIHRTNTAYLGDRAPAFTDNQAALAVQAATADRTRVADNLARFAADAEVNRAAAQTARAMMIDRISNAWKN